MIGSTDTRTRGVAATARRGGVQDFERRLADAVGRQGDGTGAALVHLEVDGAWDVRDAGGAQAAKALRDAVAATLAGHLDAPMMRVPHRACGFCVLLEDTTLDDAVEQARVLKRDVDRLRFQWHGHPFRLAACAGVLELGAQPARAGYWLTAAREACDAARELGGRGVQEVALDEHAWPDIARRREWVQHLSEIIG